MICKIYNESYHARVDTMKYVYIKKEYNTIFDQYLILLLNN